MKIIEFDLEKLSEIDKNVIPASYKKAKQIGVPRNSIRQGGGNLIGCLGECVFAELYDGIWASTMDYDVVLNKIKIDIKTKAVSCEPLSYYEVSVADYNTTQKCDYYVFVRILKNRKKGWILGKFDRAEYYKKARFRKKGDIDEDNGHEARAACHNMEIKDLKPMNPPKNLPSWARLITIKSS